MSHQPHLLYLAWGFPPAAKSCVYRKLATANSFARSGWRVTVVTLTEHAWRREQGLDTSLLSLVDPRVEIHRLPLYREDFETDVRTYSELRAHQPGRWMKQHRKEDTQQFPEAVFGRWHDQLIASVREIHDAMETPPDLLLTSASPYTFFAPALDLYKRNGLPYVIDYRDAWAINILKDVPAFTPDSRAGVFEQELVDHATEAWFVNRPIRDAYAGLYPDAAKRMHVARNGSDIAIGTNRINHKVPDPEAGLTFGFLGTVTFDAHRVRALCEGWRLAREENEVLRRSRLVFRGHLGSGSALGINAQAAVIDEYAEHGVSFGGPVAKADTAAVYESWDALLLCLVGGKYVTSGKVFDYVSTGLPIMSAHGWDHAATEILDGYPLWVRNDGVDAEDLAETYIETVDRILSASEEERAASRRHADQFERYAQLQPAVDRLTQSFAPELVGQSLDAAHQALLEPSPRGEAFHTETPVTPHSRGEHVAMLFTVPIPDVVRSQIRRVRESGGRVHLIGPESVIDDSLASVADTVTRLTRSTNAVPVDGPLRKGSPRWAKVVAQNTVQRRFIRRQVKKHGPPHSWWISTHRNSEAMRLLRDATVLTALDQGAVYAVWNAARLNAHAPAINGIGPTLDELGLGRG